jgi:hypothetical protein
MSHRSLPIVVLSSAICSWGCRSTRSSHEVNRLRDRQDIINVLGSYPHYFDEKELESFSWDCSPTT